MELKTAVNAVIGNSELDECFVIKHDSLKLHLKVWVIITIYQYMLW